MKEIYKFHKGYYKKLRLKIVVYIFFAFLAKFSMLLIPYSTKKIIDEIQFNNINNFYIYVFILVFLSVVFQISISLSYYMRNYVEISITNTIRKNLLDKMNFIPYKRLKNNTIGYFIQRIFDDCEQTKPLIISVYVDTVINLFFVISVVIIMFKLNIWVSLILFMLIPIFVFISRFFIPKIEKINEKIIVENEKLKTISEESLNGSYDIRINNGYKYINNKFLYVLKNYKNFKLKDTKYQMVYNYVFIAGLMNLSTILIYSLGGYLVLKKQLTIGTLTAYALYFSRLWDPVEYFMGLSKDIKIRKISFIRILELFNEKNEDDNFNTNLSHLQSIKIDNLSLNIEDRNIFSNLNFEINKGDKIGIKGDNGSGKSTFSNILVKIVKDYSGNIYYNELNYNSINSNELRKKVVLIPSDIFIFNGTIKENISLNREVNYDLDKYFSSIEFLSIFHKNKKDVNSLLNNNGNGLSGGEKKIIQILRGALLEGDLFILDEPLNFIDKENKSMLINYIKDTFKDKILIIISHDEEIFQCCNKIYTISNQKMVLEYEN